MNESYPTLIVENDSLVREGLRLLLEQTHFSPRTCSLEPDLLMQEDEPSILIIFAREKTELFALISQFRAKYADTRIVVLANESDLDVLTSAMEAGANAILLTSISAEGLIKSLNAVVAENIFVMDSRIWPSGSLIVSDASSDNSALERERLMPPMQGLSLREMEILGRIVEGDSNKHIARRLDIAEATVKAHVKTILRKIGVSNRTQAAIWAINNGLAQNDDIAELLDDGDELTLGAASLEHRVIQ